MSRQTVERTTIAIATPAIMVLWLVLFVPVDQAMPVGLLAGAALGMAIDLLRSWRLHCDKDQGD